MINKNKLTRLFEIPGIFAYKKVLIIGVLLITSLIQLTRLKSFTKDAEETVDFRNIYLGAVLTKSNQNPYNDSLVKIEWERIRKAENLNQNIQPGLPTLGILYPNLLFKLFMPITYISFTYASMFIKIFVLLNLILFCFLIHEFLKRQGINIGLAIIILGIFALKPSVNLINVGQISPFLFNMLFLLVTFRVKQKSNWVQLFISFLLYLKPTVAFASLPSIFTAKRKEILIYLAGPACVLAYFLFSGNTIVSSYLIQAQGQVANAYNPNVAEFPFTFEAMSNTQIESVFALTHIPKNLWLIIKATLALVTFVFFWKRKAKMSVDDLLLFGILTTLTFTYHKYYDLLLILPFAICWFYKNSSIKKLFSVCFLIHLLFPYNFLKTIHLPDNLTNNLQFLNSIFPLLALLLILTNGINDTMNRKNTPPTVKN